MTALYSSIAIALVAAMAIFDDTTNNHFSC